MAKLDHFIASNGTLYNQKFLPAALAGDNGLQHFASLVRSYFDHKGMHVQFNVIDRKTLLEAQKNPEAHRDLVVRVAGYSAQFVRARQGSAGRHHLAHRTGVLRHSARNGGADVWSAHPGRAGSTRRNRPHRVCPPDRPDTPLEGP